jgi:hypothetical protein
MMKRPTSTSVQGVAQGVLVRVAVLAAVGCALAVAAGSPARAQEGVLFKNLLGDFGIIDKERETIDYRERPPLVVPPKMELRQPVDPSAVALRNPAWPNDPDVAAKKKAEEEARKPVARSDSSVSQGGRLTPEQIRAGRKVAGGQGDPNEPRRTYGDRVLLLSPDELRATATKASEKSALAYGVEPPRTDLTQPPPGYRLPAGNAPLKTTQEAPAPREDEANPIGFIRQQREN